MKSFKFKKIDAFATVFSAGNPAGCIYLDRISDITDIEMQQIARELTGFVNEVVYLFPEQNSYLLKYYSAECEVDFCGHGTIAIMYDLITNTQELLLKDEIQIRVKNQILNVKNQIKQEDSIYITAPEAQYHQLNINSQEIAKTLEIDITKINQTFPLNFVNGGLNTLIVPINHIDDCLEINPNQLKLRDFCLDHKIDIILVFTNEVTKVQSNYRTRVFTPKFGYLEDPATGSGNSAFGYYLLKAGLWDGNILTIEQGKSHENPNVIKLRSSNINNRIRVLFGGNAIVRINGEYILSN